MINNVKLLTSENLSPVSLSHIFNTTPKDLIMQCDVRFKDSITSEQGAKDVSLGSYTFEARDYGKFAIDFHDQDVYEISKEDNILRWVCSRPYMAEKDYGSTFAKLTVEDYAKIFEIKDFYIYSEIAKPVTVSNIIFTCVISDAIRIEIELILPPYTSEEWNK